VSINLERRLQRIKEALGKEYSVLWDMTDDELAQVITGNPNTGANDISPEQLESMARGLSNETRTQTAIS
jgi:succinate dehydrogenase flavin-adding protein (antitoxin of CptAB toxin-antitoxin module)